MTELSKQLAKYLEDGYHILNSSKKDTYKFSIEANTVKTKRVYNKKSKSKKNKKSTKSKSKSKK